MKRRILIPIFLTLATQLHAAIVEFSGVILDSNDYAEARWGIVAGDTFSGQFSYKLTDYLQTLPGIWVAKNNFVPSQFSLNVRGASFPAATEQIQTIDLIKEPSGDTFIIGGETLSRIFAFLILNDSSGHALPNLNLPESFALPDWDSAYISIGFPTFFDVKGQITNLTVHMPEGSNTMLLLVLALAAMATTVHFLKTRAS